MKTVAFSGEKLHGVKLLNIKFREGAESKWSDVLSGLTQRSVLVSEFVLRHSDIIFYLKKTKDFVSNFFNLDDQIGHFKKKFSSYPSSNT